MPWTVKDVEKHKKGLSDKKKKAWVKIANGVLAACTKAGGTDCEGRAIRIANAMAPRTGESEILIPLNLIEGKEDLNLMFEVIKRFPTPGKWKVDDVDDYVDDLKDAQKKVWIKIANSIYIHCKKSIGENCYGKAVDTATAIAPLIKESIEEIKGMDKWLIETLDEPSKPGEWKVKDVDSFVSDLKDAQKKIWVKIANTIYKYCKKSGGEDCYGRAIKMATTVAPIVKESIDEIKGMEEYKEVFEIMNKETKEKDNKKIIESTGKEVEITDVIEGFQDIEILEDKNTIKNVCIISKESKNNRIYTDEALDDIVRLAEGVKSFADHPVIGMVRSVKMLIGKLTNPRRVNGKGYASFEVLENQKGWIFPLAKQMPEIAGMSIRAMGKIKAERDEKGREVVESIVELKSIDLVSEPATTKSLFEIYENLETGKSVSKKEDETMEYKDLTVKEIEDNRPELIKEILSTRDAEMDTKDKEITAKSEEVDTKNKEIETLKTKVDEYEVKEKTKMKEELIKTLIEDSELPKEAVTDVWLETLRRVEVKKVDEKEVSIEDQLKKLIADRLAIAKPGDIKGSGDEKDNKNKKKISDAEFVEGAKRH